jgi:uncharacterized protein (UPF0332 family)
LNPEARDWWNRALRALRTAEQLVDEDPDASASRAYYAVFFAVRALFALEQRTFRKHTEVEAAVHRDLVKPARWPTEVGAAFSWLANLRHTGDYGGQTHVSPEEAGDAVRKAQRVLETVRETSSEPFTP